MTELRTQPADARRPTTRTARAARGSPQFLARDARSSYPDYWARPVPSFGDAAAAAC